MKLGIILSKQQALQVLSTIAFPVKAAAAISIELAKLGPVLMKANADTLDLYKKHGALSADGQRYEVAEENKAALDADMTALLDSDVEVTLNPVNMMNVERMYVAPAHIIHLVTLDGFILSGMCRMMGVVAQPVAPVLTVVNGGATEPVASNDQTPTEPDAA